jgi:hypothetical protein
MKNYNSIPKKFEVSYVFNENVNRIATLLTETKNIEKLNKNTQLAYMFTNNTTPLTFEYTLGVFTTLDYSVKFSWNIENKLLPTNFTYNFDLVKNTVDKENSTLLVFDVNIEHPENIQIEMQKKVTSGCREICREIINNIDILLQENTDNIYEYESEIIPVCREKVWNRIININEFLKKQGILKDYKIIGEKNKVGCRFQCNFIDNKPEFIEYQLTTLEKNPKKKKWKLGMTPQSLPFMKQELFWVFIQLSENETFLYILHKFNEPISKELLNELSKKKQIMFKIIQKDIENESSEL